MKFLVMIFVAQAAVTLAAAEGRPQFPFFGGGFFPQPFFNPFFGGFPGFDNGAFSGTGGFASTSGGSGTYGGSSFSSTGGGGGSFHTCHQNCVDGVCSQVCQICSNGKCTKA